MKFTIPDILRFHEHIITVKRVDRTNEIIFDVILYIIEFRIDEFLKEN